MPDDADLVGALAGVVGRQHLVAADEDQERYSGSSGSSTSFAGF